MSDVAQVVAGLNELDAAVLAEIANGFGPGNEESEIEQVEIEQGEDPRGEDEGTVDEPAARPASSPPEPTEMARLQEFVDTARRLKVGRPIDFDFVPTFPTEGMQAVFLDDELWLVATALGLTDTGQTSAGANQARIDRIRGTPGVIALQPTRKETDVVVVHETMHLLDPPPASTTSAEPFEHGPYGV